MKNILKTIAEKSEEMSPVYRQLAQYILEEYARVAHMDISTLAAAANVSTATVTRFANSLGCGGYPELRGQLQKIIFNNYTSLDEIAGVLRRDPDEAVTDVDEALRGLPGRYQLIDKEKLRRAARMICAGRRVLLVGNQISAPFVSYTMYLLGKYHEDLVDISSMSFEDEKILETSGEQDCALVFAFQRYPNATIKAIHRLRQKGIPMIVISDSDLFPFEELADLMICVSFKHSLAFAPLMLVYSVIYEIILNVIMLDPEKAEKNVRRFDEYVERNRIYFDPGKN
ncbi:MAG: MurR/RpiR family transcriptional regulator [Clostridia bacterium]|nr:MurR/RpiR family transcriptional regulator [Clostridia bacterium]